VHHQVAVAGRRGLFAATPVDAACADALAAAILKAVRAKQAPSRIYLGLSGRWVL